MQLIPASTTNNAADPGDGKSSGYWIGSGDGAQLTGSPKNVSGDGAQLGGKTTSPSLPTDFMTFHYKCPIPNCPHGTVSLIELLPLPRCPVHTSQEMRSI
jgi:hypothetical protein